MTTPLYRADHYDAADMETGWDHSTMSTIRSAELVRRDEVIKAALRIRLFTKSERAAIRKVREHIAGLALPLYRVARLNELACSERWPTGPMGPPEPASKPMRGYGCTHGQWRDAAFLVHRAALSLMLDVRPQSYADVHDQLRMLFHATPISLEDKHRLKLRPRLTGHIARLVAGLPFTAYPPY